uniref:Uncharacterized protein n=1 Tax=Oryzias melastigma TaxID=30732 RepID=A0A3B3DZX0_ORYME
LQFIFFSSNNQSSKTCSKVKQTINKDNTGKASGKFLDWSPDLNSSEHPWGDPRMPVHRCLTASLTQLKRIGELKCPQQGLGRQLQAITTAKRKVLVSDREYPKVKKIKYIISFFHKKMFFKKS